MKEAASFIGIDFATWWFLTIGVLFAGYALLDGFDLGAGAWHLTFKKESSRRTVLNAIGPVWDGNEVWLVIGGGALFAGFPKVYATLLSVMYTPFILFLVLLVFRAIAIEFRSKEPMLWWRKLWDIVYSVSSILIAFLLGVVFGNVLEGIPINKQNIVENSSIFSFLRPFPILIGFTILSLFMTHGAIFLLLKTEGRLYTKIRLSLRSSLIFFLISFTLSTLYALVYLPRLTEVFQQNTIWLVIPILAILSIANLPRLCSRKKYSWAFVFSSLTILLFFALAASNLYPTLIHSTLNSAYSLTIYNAQASDKSLGIMLLMAAIGTPLVFTYTFFVYYTFRGKVKIDENSY
jgi:cytochrome d ubiquinol oxidase subunit II